MGAAHVSLVEAINRVAGGGGPTYPQFAAGPYEEVLVFNSPVTITLETIGGVQCFTSQGELYGLPGNKLAGSVTTGLPTSVTPATAGYLLTFPPVQTAPFNSPDVATGTGALPPGEIPPHSYTKQLYDFGGGNTIALEGPAFPKLTYLNDGGAQFWVGFVGAITQGTGKYAGARGMGGFDGSAYFKSFPPPAQFNEIVATLSKGFSASVGAYIKSVGQAQIHAAGN